MTPTKMTVVSAFYRHLSLNNCLGKYPVNLHSINALSSICKSPEVTNTSLSLFYLAPPCLPCFTPTFNAPPFLSLLQYLPPLCSDIVVGYEQTLYSTEEDDVSLEICVVIYQPLSGGAPRTFTLTYNTTDYTAGLYYITSIFSLKHS